MTKGPGDDKVTSDMAEDFRRANGGMRTFNVAMLEFQAACLALNWEAAQVAHTKAVDSIDGYFDNIAAAYKRQEERTKR